MISKEIEIICNKTGQTYDDLKKSISNVPEGVYRNDLEFWGIKLKDLDMLTDQSFTKGRMDNNIVNLSKNDVRDILEKVLIKN